MKLRTPLLAVLVAFAGCSGEAPGPEVPHAAPVSVTVSDPVRAAPRATYPATLMSTRSADVATRSAGTVVRVVVDIGDPVRAGQTLVELDGADVEARVSAASADLELARATHGRISRLAAAGAATPAELEAAAAALAAADARSADARAQRRYTSIDAPFDGVVEWRHVHPGDLAAPGRPLLRLVGSGALEVRADLPADRSGTVSVGDPARVRTGDGTVRNARVVRVMNTVDPSARTFHVVAVMDGPPGPDLRPGAFVRLEVGRTSEAVRWIPADAVLHRGQLSGVMVVDADTLRLRWVRLGRERAGAVELLAGPEAPVVRRPTSALADGDPVATVRQEAFHGPDVAPTDAMASPSPGPREDR
ncbi:MAG: efflux RND transporter periplasmic adaptor subunit [Longimicrobiales bacterium]